MTGHDQSKSGVFRFLVDNSLLLIAGAVAALVWANWADQQGSDSYREFVHFDIRTLWGGGGDHSGHAEAAHAATANSTNGHSTTDLVASASYSESDHGKGSAAVHDSHDTAAGEASSEGGGHHWYHLSFIINDLLMALFFAIAAKEVWESLLPGGALSNPRKAATPLLATVGGILGPVLFYLSGAYLTGSQAELGQGWAIPCATDIAFSYLIARMIFGGSHPAIAFLLLLAIADDAIGLMILAVFYPAAPIEPIWLLLTVGAMALAWLFRKLKVHSHWAYMLGPGALCWFSFYQAHIHPALGLVPIIPFLPSAASDLGIFVREELERKDTLK